MLSSFRAFLYDAFQFLVGADKGRELLAQQFNLQSYVSVLDLGCGNGMLPGYLATEADYLGVDLCPARVSLARRRWPDHDFLVADVADLERHVRRRFHLIVAVGLVHHLDDESARRLLQLAGDMLEEKGRILLVDPVIFDGQGVLSRLLCLLDAGSWVRSIEGYKRIVPDELLVLYQEIRSDLLWIPQSLQVMALTCRKREFADV